jgi:hypothetical protein
LDLKFLDVLRFDDDVSKLLDLFAMLGVLRFRTDAR